MKFLRRLWTAVAICAIFVPCTFSGAAEESDNAALAYWQAFAQLPRTNKEQEELLRDVVKVEIDESALALGLIKQCDGAMQSLRRASTMPECDWGLEFSAGPHMVMPHLSKARHMARLVPLHARHSFQSGQADVALETLGNTLLLARRLGEDQILISLLVQYAIERIVIDVLARELPDLDAAHLDALAKRVDDLPKGGSLRAAFELEQKVYVGWARHAMREAKDDTEAVQLLRSAVAEMAPDDEPVVPQASRQQIAKWLDETWNDYDEIVKMLDVTPKARKEKWATLLQRIHAENPYSSMVLPALERCCEIRDKRETIWALFRAAIMVARDGSKRLADFEDPFGDGPFKYEETPGGFRLWAQLEYRGKRVELAVGSVEKN